GDFFTQPLGLLGAFLLNLVQPLKLFLLLAQLLDHALHRSGHERGSILRTWRARRNLLLLPFLAALKKFPQQIHNDSRHSQRSDAECRDDFPNVWRAATALEHSPHQLCCLIPFLAFAFRDLNGQSSFPQTFLAATATPARSTVQGRQLPALQFPRTFP